jgi:HEAT repeat protein
MNPDTQDSKANKPAMRQAEIEKNLQGVNSPDPRERYEAVKRLGELHAAPEVILRFMGDVNLSTREAATNALGNFEGDNLGELRPEVLMHLGGALTDKNNFMVSAAVRSLGRLHACEFIPEIRKFLEEKDRHLVRTTLIALGKLEDRESLETIEKFLDPPSSIRIRMAAWQTIALLNYTPAIPKLLAAMQSLLEKQPLAYMSFGTMEGYIAICKKMKVEESAPLLIKIIQSEIGLRTTSLDALSNLGLNAFPVELLPLLDDPNPELRAALLRLIIQTHYPVPPLRVRRFLHDKSEKVSMAALDLVCQLHDSGAVSTVRYLCQHSTKVYLRARAIAALVKLIGLQSIPDLQIFAFDESLPIRLAVAQSLGGLGSVLPDQALAILEFIRNDKAVRETVESILRKLDDYKTSPEPLQRPKPWLPFPDPWIVTRSDFLTACTQWKTALDQAEIATEHADEVLEIQSALIELITRLNKVQQGLS